MNIYFYLNDADVDAPANWQSLLVELNFDKDAPESRVTINDWDWIRKNSDALHNWLEGGLIGEVGVFEGVPFRIEVADSGVKRVLYDGYLDLSTGVFQCNQVTATAKERLSIDYINDIADSFTFEYLNTRLVVKDDVTIMPFSDRYVYIPYVISTVPSAQDAILAAVSLITMIIELQSALKAFISYLVGLEAFAWEDLFKIILHVAYIAFLFATILKVTQDLFNAIIQPVKYHAGMKIKDLCIIGSEWMGFDFASETILELDEFEDLVILPQKYNMEVNDEIDFLQGFTDAANLALPTGVQLGDSLHQEEQGYYNGTFGQLLRDLKVMFNAKVIIEENPSGRPILRLERRDYSTSTELYNLPPIDNNELFRLNADEFNANYLVEFALDGADKNTYTPYVGTVYQSRTQPKSPRTDYTLMKGLNQVSIPFALGKRKVGQTIPEKILIPIIIEIEQIVNAMSQTVNTLVFAAWLAGNVMITQINNIITSVNALPGGISIPTIDPNLLGEIEELPLIPINEIVSVGDNRSGMLLLENDFINVPKIIKIDTVATQTPPAPIVTGGVLGFEFSFNDAIEYVGGIDLSAIDYGANKVNADNDTIVSAENIYKKFHYINSFVPTTNGDPTDLSDLQHNQWKIYEFNNVPFCFEAYEKVRKDNKIIFVDKFGLVESIEWNIFKQTANIRFRVNELYTNNLENVELIPIGR